MTNFIALNVLSGAYLVIFALVMKTQNFQSSVTFKVIPFFIGMGLLVQAAKQSGLI